MPELKKSSHLLLVLFLGIGAARGNAQASNDRLIIGQEVILEFHSEEYKTYKYISTNSSTTTVIVTACSAPIEWNVFQSAVGANSTWVLVHSSVTTDRDHYEFPWRNTDVEPIEYTVKLKAKSGYGSILAANITCKDIAKNQKQIPLQMKWKSESDLILRWHRHQRSGQTEENYCVLITTGKQTNLCGALKLDDYKHLRNTTGRLLAASFIENYHSFKDMLVYCTNTNLLKLNVNQLLHQMTNKTRKTSPQHLTASLYAFEKDTKVPQNIANNETYSIKPSVVLKENKIAVIKLANGPVTMSLKVLQKSFVNSKQMDFYIIPCDVRLPINVDVTFNGNQLAGRRDIVGFGKLSVPNVQMKKPYVITVSAGRVNLTSPFLKGVQVFATTQSSLFNPFPEMPRLPAVKEYKTLRSCRSVTVGWIPPNGLRTATYCMIVKQGKANPQTFQGNQCNMNGQLRRGKVHRNDVAKMCKQLKHTARISVLTQKIDKLKPGKFYNVQIMVRKPKGRMLSYEILQVRTKSKC